jgi:hypothetical protein
MPITLRLRHDHVYSIRRVLQIYRTVFPRHVRSTRRMCPDRISMIRPDRDTYSVNNNKMFNPGELLFWHSDNNNLFLIVLTSICAFCMPLRRCDLAIVFNWISNFSSSSMSLMIWRSPFLPDDASRWQSPPFIKLLHVHACMNVNLFGTH